MKTSTIAVQRLLTDSEKLLGRIEQAENALQALRQSMRQRRWFLESLRPESLRAGDRERLARLLDGTAHAQKVIELLVRDQDGRFTVEDINREFRRRYPTLSRRVRHNTAAATLFQLTRLKVLRRIKQKGLANRYILTR